MPVLVDAFTRFQQEITDRNSVIFLVTQIVTALVETFKSKQLLLFFQFSAKANKVISQGQYNVRCSALSAMLFILHIAYCIFSIKIPMPAVGYTTNSPDR